jgi:hypothetical protein
MPLTERLALKDSTQSPAEIHSPKWHRAAHAVLSTNELLCNIIAHLPLKDIVAATGICKSWRNAMAADLAVQQALFLKPVELSEVLVETRQLLALGESETVNIDRCTVVGQLNPLAEKMCGSIKFRAAQSQVMPLPRQCWRGSDRECLARFGDNHPDGIWREMFITQPPCIRVHVKIYELRTEDILGIYGSKGTQKVVEEVNEKANLLERSDGVKLGDLYDFIFAYHHWETRSVRTTVRRYVAENIDLPDRTSCMVRNGKVRLPTQLPDLPDVDCDAFGGNFEYDSTRESWALIHREQSWPNGGDEGSDSDDEDPGYHDYDYDEHATEHEGRVELNDEYGLDEDEDEFQAYYDNEEAKRLSPKRPRINAIMLSRKHTVGHDSSEEGENGKDETS